MLTIALAVTVIGNAGLVSCQVVGETALARIVPREALGRVIGIFNAVSRAAIIAGAVLAPVLLAATSLRASLLILGAAALMITLLSGLGLRGLDARNAQRADALASQGEGPPGPSGHGGSAADRPGAARRGRAVLPAATGVDVVVQGAPAHAFYAVADGRVVVHRDGQAVVHLGPGDSFGERGLLDRAPRNATVTTEMDTTLLRVEGARCSTPSRRRQACGPRWISAAARPEYRSRRARLRWWTTRAGQRHDHRRATVIVVGGGYEGKRRYYQRLARLGARLVIGDEPGHWSESLADQNRRDAMARNAPAVTPMSMPVRSLTPWNVRAFTPMAS